MDPFQGGYIQLSPFGRGLEIRAESLGEDTAMPKRGRDEHLNVARKGNIMEHNGRSEKVMKFLDSHL